jgi:hypothetical protein
MDDEFNQRWQRAESPFDGVTLFLADYVPLAALRTALTAVVTALHARYPHSRMFQLHDWHEHDGFVLEATPTTWDEIRAALASDGALERTCTDDSYVRTAWFPEERDFLLRFHVRDLDDPSPVHHGIFDVTAREPLASRLREAVAEAGTELSVLPAKAFFDRKYRG